MKYTEKATTARAVVNHSTASAASSGDRHRRRVSKYNIGKQMRKLPIVTNRPSNVRLLPKLDVAAIHQDVIGLQYPFNESRNLQRRKCLQIPM
jgi:hypothetical protein